MEKVRKNNKTIELELEGKNQKNEELEEKKTKQEHEIMELLEDIKGSEKYFSHISEKYRNILDKRGSKKVKAKYKIQICSDDMIKADFWNLIKM